MGASWALLNTMVYQHTKALILCSRGLGIFPKTLSITLMEANHNTGKVFWDILEKKLATYEDGSQ